MAPALGVIRLAGYLNSGHYAESFEPNLPMLTNEGPFIDEILKKKWDIIGFSILEETFIHDIKNMRLAEKICPEAIFVVRMKLSLTTKCIRQNSMQKLLLYLKVKKLLALAMVRKLITSQE